MITDETLNEASLRAYETTHRWELEAHAIAGKGLADAAIVLAALIQISREILHFCPEGDCMRVTCVQMLSTPGIQVEDAISRRS